MASKPNTMKILAAVSLLATTTATVGGDFGLSWYTIDGGGDMFTEGGTFGLSGTIGQPDAKTEAMIGGTFTLTGGFWNRARIPCPGDADGDRFVGPQDLTLLLAAWYSKPGDPNWDPNADFDHDGFVGPQDLNILLSNWFESCW